MLSKMGTHTDTRRTLTESPTALVFWIPIAEAERRFRVSREELIRRVQDGELRSRRILCEGDLVVAVSSTELEREFRQLAEVKPKALSTRESAGLEALRAELEDERVARARVEGELEASANVERSIQRYADRLELELTEARKQSMTLARALGRAEELAAQRATPRLEAKPTARKKRWWPF